MPAAVDRQRHMAGRHAQRHQRRPHVWALYGEGQRSGGEAAEVRRQCEVAKTGVQLDDNPFSWPSCARLSSDSGLDVGSMRLRGS